MTAPRGRIGWLPDPSGRFELRLRMRQGWTQRVRVGTAEAVDAGFDPDAGSDGTTAAEPQAATERDGEWRADPTGRFEQRWWEEGRFTRRVRHGGAVATDTIGPVRARRGWGRRADPEGPGWRPDPDGAGQRYHDGRDWTAKWRPGPPASSSPPGSLRAWLPRSAGLLVLLVLSVLVTVAVTVAILTLLGGV